MSFKGTKHSLFKALLTYFSGKRSHLLHSERSQPPSDGTAKESPGHSFVAVA